jgi:enoyl-CoA hydratase
MVSLNRPSKLALNRGADAGGFHDAVNAGLDIVAPLYAVRTEVGQRLNEITRKDGLGAALKWRSAQLAE